MSRPHALAALLVVALGSSPGVRAQSAIGAQIDARVRDISSSMGFLKQGGDNPGLTGAYAAMDRKQLEQAAGKLGEQRSLLEGLRKVPNYEQGVEALLRVKPGDSGAAGMILNNPVTRFLLGTGALRFGDSDPDPVKAAKSQARLMSLVAPNGSTVARLQIDGPGSEADLQKGWGGKLAEKLKTWASPPAAYRPWMDRVVGMMEAYTRNPVGGAIKGTGYCLGNGRIVSAAHVLYGASWQNINRKVRMKFLAVPVLGAPDEYPRDYLIFPVDLASIRAPADLSVDLVTFTVAPGTRSSDKATVYFEASCRTQSITSAEMVKMQPLADEVFVVGYPGSAPTPQVAYGGLSDRAPKKAGEIGRKCPVPIFAGVFPGMSGGPIVHATLNKVVGVLVYAPYEEAEAYYVPLHRDSAVCGESAIAAAGLV